MIGSPIQPFVTSDLDDRIRSSIFASVSNIFREKEETGGRPLFLLSLDILKLAFSLPRDS